MIKHSINQSIKSVSITCNQEFVVFGAMRKIVFQSVQTILESKRLGKKKGLNMTSLGNSNQEVQGIDCHPMNEKVVASISGNNVFVWDLDRPENQTVSVSKLISDSYLCARRKH